MNQKHKKIELKKTRIGRFIKILIVNKFKLKLTRLNIKPISATNTSLLKKFIN